MSKHIKNITLSSQRADISAYNLIDIVEKYGKTKFFRIKVATLAKSC